MKSKVIIEKKLGISGDYQFKALRSRNFLQSNWHSNKLHALGKLIDLYKPKTVLDLGAGSGNFEFAFAKKLKKITAVDYNEEAIGFLMTELKRRAIKNVELVNQDILNLSKLKKLGRFDMIVLVDAIEHLQAKAALELIKSFKGMLNEGGKVVVITPNYRSFWPLIEKSIDIFTSIPHLENMQHITKYHPGKLKDIFRNNNFDTIKSATFNGISFLFPGKKLSTFICGLELGLGLPFGNLMEYVFELRD